MLIIPRLQPLGLSHMGKHGSRPGIVYLYHGIGLRHHFLTILFLGTAVDPSPFIAARSVGPNARLFDDCTIAGVLGEKYADEMVMNRQKTTTVSRPSLPSQA